ncbi:alpha/beta hydrolase [Paenibacillus illinoisensis]|uniref:alpha/beta hydrolase n=1 Tax=Paenibacillus illinoisensis TaxID=59845 RepID=UPI00301D8B3E
MQLKLNTEGTARPWYRRRLYWIPGVIVMVTILTLYIGAQITPKVPIFFLKTLIKLAPSDSDVVVAEGVSHLKDVAYIEGGRSNSMMDIYYPSAATELLPVVLWVHGGGWVLGDKKDIAVYAMELAERGFVVVSMNYALAPDATYPTPVFQTNQALTYIQNHAAEFKGDPHNIFLAGNSAGAQIASQTAAVVTNQALAQLMNIQPSIQPEALRGVLLYCGPYNMSTVGESGFPLIRTFLWSYTGIKAFEEFSRLDEMSTVLQVTPNYPPSFITSGNHDPLTGQSVELAQTLKRLDVETETLFFTASTEKLGHDYQFQLQTDGGKRALEEVVRFLQKHRR